MVIVNVNELHPQLEGRSCKASFSKNSYKNKYTERCKEKDTSAIRRREQWMHVCGVQFVSPHLPETASSTGEADVLKRQAEHELCRNPPFSSDLEDTGCRFTAHLCSYIIIRVYYIRIIIIRVYYKRIKSISHSWYHAFICLRFCPAVERLQGFMLSKPMLYQWVTPKLMSYVFT